MEMMDKTCKDFLGELASRSATPGGGGAAALVGAVGAALGNMVGCLTAGKPKYAAVEGDILALNQKAAALQISLFFLFCPQHSSQTLGHTGFLGNH